MKAAVIYGKGSIPQYTDFPEPSIKNDNELLMTVKAAAVKNLDKSRASGKHYSEQNDISQAKVVGGDGAGVLEDGTRVYALGSGMIAEKAIIEKDRIVKLPEGIDYVTAAALPNAVAGSAMALLFRAKLKVGETVLINGATGFTGKMAIQIAKHYGASKIIATGRNEKTLNELLELGADEVISLKEDHDKIITRLNALHSNSPFDIVIDYLWGHTAELILSSLKGKGSFTHKTRFVSVGAVTGDTITLSAENLRSVDITLSGSGLGSWTKDDMRKLFTEIVPEMFELAASKKLKVDTITYSLKDIDKLWEVNSTEGKRLVITM